VKLQRLTFVASALNVSGQLHTCAALPSGNNARYLWHKRRGWRQNLSVDNKELLVPVAVPVHTDILDQRYSIFFVRVPPHIISLQL
jgi:hypothetical protein